MMDFDFEARLILSSFYEQQQSQRHPKHRHFWVIFSSLRFDNMQN